MTEGLLEHQPFGRLGAWGHLDSLPIDEARAYARRVDELGFGTLWVPETVGREPFTLLGLLAGETSSLRLGTSIVSIWGHDAQTTRMAAMTLQEATGGRFVLGLGVSHPHLAQRLPVPGHSGARGLDAVNPRRGRQCRPPSSARRHPPGLSLDRCRRGPGGRTRLPGALPADPDLPGLVGDPGLRRRRLGEARQ